MNNGVLTVDEIWARVEMFNRQSGAGTLEVYGLAEEFLKKDKAWEEIKKPFNEFNSLIPPEYARVANSIDSLQTPVITDGMSDEEVKAIQDARKGFFNFVICEIMERSEMRALSEIEESVTQNPVGYFKYLLGLYQEAPKTSGIMTQERSYAALSYQYPSFGSTGTSGAAVLKPSSSGALLSASMYRRSGAWSMPGTYTRGGSPGLACGYDTPYTAAGARMTELPSGMASMRGISFGYASIAKILASFPAETRSTIAPYLPTLMDYLRQGGKEAACEHLNALRAEGAIDEPTYGKLMEVIEELTRGLREVTSPLTVAGMPAYDPGLSLGNMYQPWTLPSSVQTGSAAPRQFMGITGGVTGGYSGESQPVSMPASAYGGTSDYYSTGHDGAAQPMAVLAQSDTDLLMELYSPTVAQDILTGSEGVVPPPRVGINISYTMPVSLSTAPRRPANAARSSANINHIVRMVINRYETVNKHRMREQLVELLRRQNPSRLA